MRPTGRICFEQLTDSMINVTLLVRLVDIKVLVRMSIAVPKGLSNMLTPSANTHSHLYRMGVDRVFPPPPATIRCLRIPTATTQILVRMAPLRRLCPQPLAAAIVATVAAVASLHHRAPHPRRPRALAIRSKPLVLPPVVKPRSLHSSSPSAVLAVSMTMTTTMNLARTKRTRRPRSWIGGGSRRARWCCWSKTLSAIPLRLLLLWVQIVLVRCHHRQCHRCLLRRVATRCTCTARVTRSALCCSLRAADTRCCCTG
jgi:hypothetical protein